VTAAAPASAAPAPAALASAAPTPQARVALPAPSGRYPVGTVSLELTDHSRANPWAASPRDRQLMVSIWYPAAGTRGYPRAPLMLPGAAAHFGSAAGAATSVYDIPAGGVDWAAALTSGHELAPVARHAAPFPVVLYSPGAGDPRTTETTLVQDLASRGYVVVTIDHTYDASEVEFPDGTVIDGKLDQAITQAQQAHTEQALAQKIFAVRVADVRYVLDTLPALDAGRVPGAVRQPLPRGLAGSLNLRETGMFGVSAGGITTAQAMAENSRITAGIDLDGSIESPLVSDPYAIVPVFQHGLRQPFMLSDIGTVNPAQAVTAEEAYVSAFFGRWLRGQDNGLLDGPWPRYPQITFVR
jgi:hypothetical protein